MKAKRQKNDISQHKRHLRYLCWQLSRGCKIKDKIDIANKWTSENRKTFFALVVGILSFSFVTTGISIIYEVTRDKPSDNIQMELSGKGNPIENIQPVINGLHQIQDRKKDAQQELKQLTDKGVMIHKELDSLLAIESKTHEDSIQIIQDYRHLQRIVNFLKKGKE